jgi:hypothetical protein
MLLTLMQCCMLWVHGERLALASGPVTTPTLWPPDTDNEESTLLLMW